MATPKRSPKIDGPKITIKSPFFRPGTETLERDQLFKLNNGGMGDFICWMAAMKWLAESYDYLRGHIICPYWFVPIAENVMEGFEKWKVCPEIPEKFKDGYGLKQAHIHPVNATMMHLLDLGFLYYAGVSPVPPDAALYPQLRNLDKVKECKPFLANRPERYAVMTPGSTAPSRTMRAKAFNETVEHLHSKGITPLFLGTSAMDKGRRVISYEEGYDLTQGLNLIDKTSTLQAAKIMSEAEMVIGVDNGLLHLAAMTEAPIVFAYTIVGPAHRRPLRKKGIIVEIFNKPEELPCTFCQEKVRFFWDHDFENCIYKDYKCLDLLSGDNFIAAINMVLENRKEDA